MEYIHWYIGVSVTQKSFNGNSVIREITHHELSAFIGLAKDNIPNAGETTE